MLLGNAQIVIISFAGCNVINVKKNLSLLSSHFATYHMKSARNFKYLKEDRGFQNKIKTIFITFKKNSLKQRKRIVEGERSNLRAAGEGGGGVRSFFPKL